jgi:hypothetical protein
MHIYVQKSCGEADEKADRIFNLFLSQKGWKKFQISFHQFYASVSSRGLTFAAYAAHESVKYGHAAAENVFVIASSQEAVTACKNYLARKIAKYPEVANITVVLVTPV